jgi:transcriptional regulator with XRE-family HTH domain
MVKPLADATLGRQLRKCRKAAGLTQQELGAKAEPAIAERTVRSIEKGVGSLASWDAALSALGLVLAGRNLPGGESTGGRIATLRRRRGLSQDALARLVGVTRPTLSALERRGRGRLGTLEAVLTTLGAGAYLAPRESKAAFFTHAGNASVGMCRETPAALLAALCTVFGRFDLDPCSPRRTRTRVGARQHWTEADDGLSMPWFGVVFMNPPYGRGLGAWVEKARTEVEQGRARTVVALIPARPDTSYFHEHVAGRAEVYFLKGKLKFGDGAQSAPFPSALAIWGAEPEPLERLDRALQGAWRVK